MASGGEGTSREGGLGRLALPFGSLEEEGMERDGRGTRRREVFGSRGGSFRGREIGGTRHEMPDALSRPRRARDVLPETRCHPLRRGVQSKDERGLPSPGYRDRMHLRLETGGWPAQKVLRPGASDDARHPIRFAKLPARSRICTHAGGPAGPGGSSEMPGEPSAGSFPAAIVHKIRSAAREGRAPWLSGEVGVKSDLP